MDGIEVNLTTAQLAYNNPPTHISGSNMLQMNDPTLINNFFWGKIKLMSEGEQVPYWNHLADQIVVYAGKDEYNQFTKVKTSCFTDLTNFTLRLR